MKRTSRVIKHLSINILVASASVYLTIVWQNQHRGPSRPPSADIELPDSEGWIPVSEAEAEMDYNARWTAIVDSDESESEKVKKLVVIALTMVIKGHTIEAFEKSMRAYGPGEVRRSLIKGIFSGAKDVPNLATQPNKVTSDRTGLPGHPSKKKLPRLLGSRRSLRHEFGKSPQFCSASIVVGYPPSRPAGLDDESGGNLLSATRELTRH